MKILSKNKKSRKLREIYWNITGMDIDLQDQISEEQKK
jgi:hypothetical protein